MTAETIGVIGGGAWGTALAQMVASDGRAVKLWAREADTVEQINTSHCNKTFLPDSLLSRKITATRDLSALAGLDIVLAVTPAQFLRSTLQQLTKAPRDLILCCKGIEAGTGLLMNEVAKQESPASEVAILAGPTFAHEVASGLPTAVTLACSGGENQWSRIAKAVARPSFRPYYSDDITGAEIGGAVKNVLAIACGVVDGLNLGQNARAALIARGYVEMLRFGEALGARAETLAGMCGLGDLVLTCSSTASRNFSLGRAIGQGSDASALMADRTTVAEGAHTAPVLAALASKYELSMPIVDAVNALIGGADAREVATTLLSRPLRREQGLAI